MHIHEIRQIEQYSQLREAWNRIYEQDSHAHVFSSWAWLYSFLQVAWDPWLVLALQEDDEYVAFLPLTNQVEKRGFVRTLNLGSFPLADYSGFISLPNFEEAAIEAFSKHIIHKLTWDTFNISDVMDPRLDKLLTHFSADDFETVNKEDTPCPVLVLPDQWEAYLENNIGRSTRQTLRRRLNQAWKLDDFQIVMINEENREQQINALLNMWESRWQLPTTIYHDLLCQCFENNCLWLQTFWSGDIPVAGLAAFIDHQRKTFAYYISGFNPDFSKISPGRAIVGHSIQCAIEDGYQVYDFLRGDEPYKYSLGAKDRFTKSRTVTRKGMKRLLVNKAESILGMYRK